MTVQLNVSIHESDLELIEKMMEEDFIDNKSAFIRKLVRAEWRRRYGELNTQEKKSEE